jgi:hypothetical protein
MPRSQLASSAALLLGLRDPDITEEGPWVSSRDGHLVEEGAW